VQSALITASGIGYCYQGQWGLLQRVLAAATSGGGCFKLATPCCKEAGIDNGCYKRHRILLQRAVVADTSGGDDVGVLLGGQRRWVCFSFFPMGVFLLLFYESVDPDPIVIFCSHRVVSDPGIQDLIPSGNSTLFFFNSVSNIALKNKINILFGT
jgi:hypothetical protein